MAREDYLFTGPDWFPVGRRHQRQHAPKTFVAPEVRRKIPPIMRTALWRCDLDAEPPHVADGSPRP